MNIARRLACKVRLSWGISRQLWVEFYPHHTQPFVATNQEALRPPKHPRPANAEAFFFQNCEEMFTKSRPWIK